MRRSPWWEPAREVSRMDRLTPPAARVNWRRSVNVTAPVVDTRASHNAIARGGTC